MNFEKQVLVTHRPLRELTQKNELELEDILKCLNKKHMASIINAFFFNTNIMMNGILYIKVKKLSSILRTGNSGADRQLVYQGMPGIISASPITEIEGENYISGPSLISLIETRISFKRGKTKAYLDFAKKVYKKIMDLSEVKDLKDNFLNEIEEYRPYLKKSRIEIYSITCCEFSNESFNDDYSKVEFAHIDSIATNPNRALDINNGVIILKSIHSDLTRKSIHDLQSMLIYCKDNKYSTNWVDNLE